MNEKQTYTSCLVCVTQMLQPFLSTHFREYTYKALHFSSSQRWRYKKVLVTPSSDFCCSCRGAIRAWLILIAHNLTHHFRIKLHFLCIISLETWKRKSSRRFYSHFHTQNLKFRVRRFFLRYRQEIMKWMACSAAINNQQNNGQGHLSQRSISCLHKGEANGISCLLSCLSRRRCCILRKGNLIVYATNNATRVKAFFREPWKFLRATLL